MWLRCGFIAPDRKKKKKKEENIAQSEVSFKKKPQCEFDVTFVSMVTRN